MSTSFVEESDVVGDPSFFIFCTRSLRSMLKLFVEDEESRNRPEPQRSHRDHRTNEELRSMAVDLAKMSISETTLSWL